jgi:hypothetical protein
MTRRELLAVAFALGCATEARPVVTQRTLPAGVVARVGNDAIQASTVERVAAARGAPPALARELSIRDALFAAAARESPEHHAAVVVAERSNLARRTLEELGQRAESGGPPTDAEVAALTAERWTDFDRPPSVRTTHAVVLVKKPEDDAAARDLAEKLASALRGITLSSDFVARTQAFPAAPFEVRAERLGPVTADGRMWDPAAAPGTKFPTLDTDYARGANAVERVGDQSPLVKSAFGYHVILLEERLPERRFSLEERRESLAAEITSRRAKAMLEDTLARLRRATPIEIERGAEGLTELVLGAP